MHVALEASDIEAIAARVAELVGNQHASPWLNTEGAAEYMACPVSRVRKLTMTGQLPSYKEGGRRLYKRTELDAFIVAGGGDTH
jgi:excisionase family DNA binding protein